MSEPEIARRCHACGASIRDHAAFCPQCGKKLEGATPPDSESHRDNASTVVETAPLKVDPGTSENPKVNDSAAGVAQLPTPAVKTRLSQPKPSSEPDRINKKTAGAPLVAGARDRVQRATGIAKHVGGDVVQRGQKLREMSSVVLDEAGYDPSLRFVLVAALLFFLFLIILLLNRFIV